MFGEGNPARSRVDSGVLRAFSLGVDDRASPRSLYIRTSLPSINQTPEQELQTESDGKSAATWII
jgi:hypothetical protein